MAGPGHPVLVQVQRPQARIEGRGQQAARHHRGGRCCAFSQGAVERTHGHAARPSCIAWRAALRPAAPMISPTGRSEEHTSEPQSLMRISYAVLCLKKKKTTNT